MMPALLALVACAPSKPAETAETAETAAGWAHSGLPESGAPAHTAESGETGQPEADRLPPLRDPASPEDLPQDPLEGVCQLALDCAEAVDSEDEKIPCALRVSSEDGRVWYDGPAVAWMRGRSSSWAPKKQYGVELRDASDESVEVDLLGMGKESDWVINGNYFDRLLVRNRLGFDLFQSWGGEERYAPQSALCELELDGEYVGAYTLVERIKRDGSRIDIEADDGEGGSFVMKHNDEGCFYWNTTATGCWKLIYPNEDEIAAGSSAGVTAALASWEEAIQSADPYDADAGVYAHVDLDSLVDIVILEEFFKNEDAYYTSMHIWKDRGGTIHFTPWDLDMTFGQFPYYPYGDYGSAEVWIDWRPQMWAVMTASPEFQARLVARWEELRAGSMRQDALFAAIDHLQDIYGEAIDRNFERWPIETINYGGWFYEVSSYADEDAHVRDYIERRLAWMDENIGSYAGD